MFINYFNFVKSFSLAQLQKERPLLIFTINHRKQTIRYVYMFGYITIIHLQKSMR
jgi:hypothetical protein